MSCRGTQGVSCSGARRTARHAPPQAAALSSCATTTARRCACPLPQRPAGSPTARCRSRTHAGTPQGPRCRPCSSPCRRGGAVPGKKAFQGLSNSGAVRSAWPHSPQVLRPSTPVVHAQPPGRRRRPKQPLHRSTPLMPAPGSAPDAGCSGLSGRVHGHGDLTSEAVLGWGCQDSSFQCEGKRNRLWGSGAVSFMGAGISRVAAGVTSTWDAPWAPPRWHWQLRGWGRP